MKAKLSLISLAGLLGLLAFLVACSATTVPVQQMTWWEIVRFALIQDNFLGYLIPLLLGVVGLFLRVRMLRFAILAFAIVYLGFVLGLRLSGLGGPSTFILFLHETGIKVNMSFYLTWVVLIVLGIFVGRLFCGWVCPMGAFQQFLFRKDMALKVSPRIHNWLRWLRFVVLAVMIITVLAWGMRWWGANDPFRNLFRLSWELTSITGTVLLVFVLAGSLFVFAPWCKYVCPLGATLALFSKLSLWKVKIDEAKCTDCKRCYKVDCDYQAITPGNGGVKPKVNQLECTTCGECIVKCPEAALKMTWFTRNMKEKKPAA
ncbi:MAG: 4Fe-4S binding protein [Chloroflexota bacterium]